MVLVPSNALMALLPQRPIEENIALPCSTGWPAGAPSAPPRRRQVREAVTRLSIDTRAAAQARRLSGGNQQKLTIGRWLAAGFRTLLLFDPTRGGIDVGTKHQIYDLVRELADGGAAIVMFTSELREIGLVCDRAAVLHNGAIVAELPPTASENELLTAAHGWRCRRHDLTRAPRWPPRSRSPAAGWSGSCAGRAGSSAWPCCSPSWSSGAPPRSPCSGPSRSAASSPGP